MNVTIYHWEELKLRIRKEMQMCEHYHSNHYFYKNVLTLIAEIENEQAIKSLEEAGYF